jgi:putative ABC transport system permease protein
MWSIAIKTLLVDRGKLATAVIGVVFSIVLMNIQGGLFVGLIRKASLLIDQGDADLWVGHRQMKNVDFPHDIPRSWENRIRSVDGVARAEPYIVGHSVMTLPSGGFEQVLVVGCDPASLLGTVSDEACRQRYLVHQTDGVLVDSRDAHKIENPQIGDVREIGRRRARIVGFTEGVLGFLVTPYVFTTIDRASSYLHKDPGLVSYFLVQIEPSANAEEVCERIRQRVPEAEAFTSDRYSTESIDYWLKRTGLGISFGASTALGLLVGLAIVGQTLYASVLDRISEFGALKAIGASDRQVYGMIFNQAMLLALVGSCIGVTIVYAVHRSLSTPRAPIAVSWQMALGSTLLVTLICLVASIFPYLRIRRIDPAMVLQG